MKLDPFTTALFALLSEQQRTGLAVLNWLWSHHDQDKATGRTYCIAATLIWRATVQAGELIPLWDHEQGRRGLPAVTAAVQKLLLGLADKLDDPFLPEGYRLVRGRPGAPPALLFVGLPAAMPDFLQEAPHSDREPPPEDEMDTAPVVGDDTRSGTSVDEDEALKNDATPLPPGALEQWQPAWLADLWHDRQPPGEHPR